MWLRQVVELGVHITNLIADYDQLHPTMANTRESANVDALNSLQTRPPENAIQNSIVLYCFSSITKCKKSCILWRKIQFANRRVLDLVNRKPDIDGIFKIPVNTPAQQVAIDPVIIGMQSMLDEVWSHVENDRQEDQYVRLIGLYGMGGVGKTTLLKAINNKLCSSTLNFDLQVLIVVSKTPNLEKIQNDIGKKIGLHGGDWERKDSDEKSTAIYNVLLNKRYILLLDDVWECLDLTMIGIPHPNFQNKSKIIFTTRSKDVCGQMKATQIHVQCLNEDESWNLFKSKVGEDALNGHSDITNLAKDVMQVCCGLPLALKVIGLAMALKTEVSDWKHAINMLQSYAGEVQTMTDEVFTPLKYSYDNLKNDAIRSCFLYCSLYAEDQEISKIDLIDKWICEGYLGRFHDLDKDRNEGYSYINTLVHASLLETTVYGYVKMHDVIRNMALWIAGADFYVKVNARLTEVPRNVEWKDVKKLSLMDNYIEEFNNGLNEVTRLTTILLFRGRLISSINADIWKFVPNLKVLDLSGCINLTSLPEEFCELVSLQYLNLSFTGLHKLPNGFQKLVGLKDLNLYGTKIYTIKKGVLSGMKELSIFRCGGYHCSVGFKFLSVNLVKEFKGLSCLQDVTIPATSRVEIANLTSSIKMLSCTTELFLVFIDNSTSLDISFVKQMKRLRSLHIFESKVKKIVVPEKQILDISTINNQNGFKTLCQLWISSCNRLKNMSWVVLFPNLESIDVSDCDEMETLVSENEYRLDSQVEPFAKLKTLHLRNLPKLGSIYFTSLSFPCLNSLAVGHDCNNLKRLPFNSGSCNEGRGMKDISGYIEWWNELDWEDEATTQTIFSSRFVPLVN